MLIFKLIRKALFLSQLGIVEGGGGGASDDEQDDVALADDEQQEDGEQDAGADDAAGEGDDEQDEGEKAGADGDDDADAAEVVVSIGDEPPRSEEEDKAPEWVRDLRKQNREMARELRRRDAEIAGLKSGGGGGEPEPQAIDPGPEPTLESCDFDAEAYAKNLKAWMQRKTAADAQAEKARQAKEQQQAEWHGRLTAYAKSKAALKVRDMDDAEAVAQDTLTTVQQGVILSAAENPALLIYAIGKNPAKAKELAAITDPVKFAVAIGRLETKLKVQPRRTAPPPERVPQSNAPGAAGSPAELKRLEDEARRTGDYTKVLDFKRKQRAAQK